MDEASKLLSQIANNKQAAFKPLYELFSAKVYNTALSYVQNKFDAEEVTQDVFMKVVKNAKKFKGNSTVSTWIYRITINTSLTFIEKRKRKMTSSLEELNADTPSFEHPGVSLENKEKAKYLFAVIDTLVPSQKNAFILSYIENLPRQEVADIMETSLKAVESLLQRAKGNLREKLADLYK